MCGIAGIAALPGIRTSDPALVDQMLAALSHRGPDDQHTWADTHAVVGARRLSIIDLSGGRQPMTDESGQLVVCQNGEVYNYRELREQLVQRGHRLRTDCDTETIVHLYEDHGLDFVRQLRGMFAIAIWDARRSVLILARDRLGKKPLYWRLHDGRLSFGSELKALMVDPELERRVDRDSLAAYLRYQYVPSPRTILEGVSKLPPASILTWDGSVPQIQRYWEPTYQPKTRRSLDDDVEAGLELLRESVRLRLRSDVPVGVFLSGGMDSSVVTALVAEAASEPVRTFSIGFENRAYDELDRAQAVAQRFATVHTSDVVRIDAVGLLPDLAYHYDEPFADSSAVPMFYVSRMAAEQLKVVLTGDGGDESFGGYTRYRLQRLLALFDGVPTGVTRLGVRSSRALLAPISSASLVRQRLGTADRLLGFGADERYAELMSIVGGPGVSRLLGEDVRASTDDYLLSVLRAAPRDTTDRMLFTDLLTYLPEDLLVKVDRASMANSLEARSPLLDQEVVDFAARLPTSRKIQGSKTKVVLRAIAHRLMPEDLVERPKMGFAVPIGDWFRAELGDAFRDLVLHQDARSRDYLDMETVAGMLEEHESGKASREAGLWAILMFEMWARTWLSPQDPAPRSLM